MSEFGQQEMIYTPSRGWAKYYSGINRYEVGSRMWSNGGGSIIGYAYNQEQLEDLLQKAEAKSLHSKQQAEARGEAHAFIPAGYEVNDTGELELIDDLAGFNSEPY